MKKKKVKKPKPYSKRVSDVIDSKGKFKLDKIQSITVVNKKMKPHDSNSKCWCKPVMVYKDKNNKNEVLVHKK